jgi:hypothetical protein
MTQPPQQPGRPGLPEPDPDATRIRATGSPQPQPEQPPQWQQPHPGPLPDQRWTGQPGTPQPRRGIGRTLLFVAFGVVVVGLLASALVLFLFTGDDSVRVADLGRGDCLKGSAIADGSGDLKDFEVVACDQSHDAEVVASAELDGSESPSDACLQAISDAGTSVAALAIDDREVRPLSAGDRVACLVVGAGLEGSILE